MALDAQWRADITRQMGDMAKAQQDTAIVLERILGRLNGVEKWQTDADERREWQEQRRDTRDDKSGDNRRANIAIVIAAISAATILASDLVGVVFLIVTHWKP